MLGKIGAFTLGLLCLVSTSSFVLGADDPGTQGAVSITEMREAAGLGAAAGDIDAKIAQAEAMLDEGRPFVAREILDQLVGEEVTDAQKVRLGDLSVKVDKGIRKETAKIVEAAGPGVSAEQVERADALLREYRQKYTVEKELKQRQAAELTAQAKHALYYENNAAEAARLAAEALSLDPTNKDAENVRIEADAQKGVGPAIERKRRDDFLLLPSVRLEAARQTLDNTIARAQQLYAEGEYGQSLKEWRRAEMAAQALSASMPVADKLQTIEKGLQITQVAYGRSERELAEVRKQEAERLATERSEDIAEMKRLERARLVEDLDRLIEEKKFDEANSIVTDLDIQDRSDELVPMFKQRISDEEHLYKTREQNFQRDHGDRRVDLWTNNKETVPGSLMSFPDKEFWQTVVRQRDHVKYPSADVYEEMEPEDRLVYDQLDQKLPFSFQETPIDQVVDFLQEVTEPSYLLITRDIPADGGLVTLDVETTLKKALDHITTLTGLAWKVQDGVIKIGSPESLRTYDMRVYDIRDLLISFEDTTSGDTDDNNGSSTSSRSGSSSFGSSFQFGSGRTAAQYGSSSSSSEDDDEEGFGDMTDRAQNLVLLVKQACGTDTWVSLASTGLIDISDDDDGGGGTSGGGGGGGTDLPLEFGLAPGGGGGGAFGAPAGGQAFGFPGEAGAFGMPQTQQLQAGPQPQGRAFVMANNPGDVMIVQTPEVHDCIEALLRQLREAMRIQVSVDVRFLSVATDFLREVGFNWDDFSLTPDSFTGDFGSLDGMGMSSGSYGGFSPFLTPAIDAVVAVVDPADPTAVTYQGVSGYSEFLLGSNLIAPVGTVDDTTGGLTYIQTPLTGQSFIGTGIPFFPGSTGKGMTLDVGYGSDSFQLSGFFRMAHERNSLRTLSSPQITLANGQRGYITVQTENVYVDGYDVTDGVLVPTVASVADVADLTVRPIVSADRAYVFLELLPTIQTTDLTQRFDYRTFTGVSGGDDGGAGAGAEVENFIALPRVLSEQLATTVGVPDQGVVIVGGLTTSAREQHEAGVPILDRIPILKRLFSSEGRSVDRETLFVIARPHILMYGRPDAEQDRRME